MIRIIDGVAYEVKPGPEHKVKAFVLGNGHIEVTASRQSIATELDWDRGRIADHEAMIEKWREENEEALRERSVKSAARRARNRVRRLAKAMGVDTLVTLTYRANMTDLATCKAHLKEFNRRLLRQLPDFAFVAAFERQERGAWHVHLATRRIPSTITLNGRIVNQDRNAQQRVRVKSYDAMRAVWRSVVGDLGGTVNVARRVRQTSRSAAEIAAYIAGYIVKEFADGEKWSNRWTHFGKDEVPEPVELGRVSSVRDMLDVAFSLLHDGHTVVSLYLNRWHDGFYLAAEGGPS